MGKIAKTAILTVSAMGVSAAALMGPAHAVIDEIRVTAQKREQSLQDVPIAVSAFDAAFLEDTGFQNIFDLRDYTPGLYFTQSQTAGQTSVFIRGVGTSGNNAGLEPSVGVFVDGVYRARSGSAIYDMVDLERIEVLRGPQGTLFGKNTSSGAMSIVSKAPEYEFGGNAEASIGNLGFWNVKGTVTGPIVEDKLAVRLTGNVTKRDGYIDNIALGTDINDRDRWGLKGQVLFEPTETLSMRLIADYSKSDESCCGGVPFLNGPTDGAVAFMGGTVIPGADFDNRDVAINDDPVSDVKDYGVSLEINWDVGNHTLTSVTGWRNYDFFSSIDADFLDLDIIPINSRDWSQSAFSQEIRIANNNTETFEYVAGAYYFQQDLDMDEQLRFGADASLYVDLIGAVSPALISAGINATALPSPPFPPGATIGALFGPVTASIAPGAVAAANPFPDGSGVDDFHKQDHESWAVFAQGTWHVTDRFDATLGLRYINEEKTLDSMFTETTPGGVTVPLAVSTVPDLSGAPLFLTSVPLNMFANFQPTTPIPDFTTDYDDEAITGTAKLAYAITDDVQTYASYSRGYKSGGTNVTRVIPGSGINPDFDPEIVDSYEIGVKGTFFDNRLRLNTALYFMEVEDFQDVTFLGTQFLLRNAGTIESKGVEIEALATPTEWLTLQSQVTYQDATFESFVDGPCNPTETPKASGFCDRSGDPLPNSPEWTIYGTAMVEQPIGSMTGYIRGEFTWRDDMVTATTNDPRSIQDSFTLFNGRIGLRSEDERWEVVLWGRNLADETYQSLSFDGVLQAGKLYAYPNEPRTYGVTVRTQF